MFAKVKQFVVQKAFSFAFMRYDRDNSNSLNKDQLTSMINDGFQLLRIPKQLSWLQMGFIMQFLDQDSNGQVSKDQAYYCFANALQKFGGIAGFAKFAGINKSSNANKTQQLDQYAYIPKDQQSQEGQVQFKISGKLEFNPPEDIDESMLQNLPPVGQNLPPQDLQKQNQNKQNNQQGGWDYSYKGEHHNNQKQQNGWNQSQSNNKNGQNGNDNDGFLL